MHLGPAKGNAAGHVDLPTAASFPIFLPALLAFKLVLVLLQAVQPLLLNLLVTVHLVQSHPAAALGKTISVLLGGPSHISLSTLTCSSGLTRKRHAAPCPDGSPPRAAGMHAAIMHSNAQQQCVHHGHSFDAKHLPWQSHSPAPLCILPKSPHRPCCPPGTPALACSLAPRPCSSAGSRRCTASMTMRF